MIFKPKRYIISHPFLENFSRRNKRENRHFPVYFFINLHENILVWTSLGFQKRNNVEEKEFFRFYGIRIGFIYSSCCEKTIFPKRKSIFHFQSYVLLKFFNFPISPGSSSLKNLIEIRILARLVDTSGFVGYFSIAKRINLISYLFITYRFILLIFLAHTQIFFYQFHSFI